jgi:hypothetical protein
VKRALVSAVTISLKPGDGHFQQPVTCRETRNITMVDRWDNIEVISANFM